MKSYGPRFDTAPDGLAEQAMRTALAESYEVAVVHYHRRVGAGTIRCETLKGEGGPAQRIVRLVADYTAQDGIPTQHVVVCRSIEEEAAELERLEAIMRWRRPIFAPELPPAA